MFKGKITELLAIFTILVFLALGYEDGRKGSAKKADALKSIKEKIESPEGIYIEEGIWRDAVYMALPMGIDIVVDMLNRAKAFIKSK